MESQKSFSVLTVTFPIFLLQSLLYLLHSLTALLHSLGMSGEQYDEDDDFLPIPLRDTKRDSVVTFEEPGHAGGDSEIGPTAMALLNRVVE